MSPAGKRDPGRGASGRRPEARVTYTPRPHLEVGVRTRKFTALLDTGSEISFVNDDTARALQELGHTVRPTEGAVHLADGSSAAIPGSLHVPVTIWGRRYSHQFKILPTLTEPFLIGVDLWARTGCAIPPPPHASQLATIENEPARLQAFLQEELAKFEPIRGPTDRATHHIRVRNSGPIKQRYRPRNPAMQAVIDAEVDKMEKEGIIEPSRSAWSSPVVIVRKKDGTPRFCVDYRRVNDVTERDAYPLPHIAATLDKLRGARYFSTLDLKSGYWQVPLTPESRPITAFTVPGRGLMQFRVMPFGLHSAPATFQRLLDTVLGADLEPRVFVYLDDIVVSTETFEQHLATLREVFRRLREAQLRLNPDKCRFCCPRIKYLGHIVDREGIQTDPDKVRAITDWPVPTTVRQIRQFLGIASWYRRFIRDFSTTAAPLTALTRKGVKWSWGPSEQTAFEHLKGTLTAAPVLACPDFNRRFVLQTDASQTGIGAVLTQFFPEGERVIAYASRTLNGAEKNYSATELECLAVLWGVRKMRDYIEGYQFTVITDHQSLKWLQKLESPTGRLGRWAFELQQYDFEIKYRRGTLNRVADALSRQPVVCNLAIVRCPWYSRMHRAVKHTPETHPDYRIRDDKLYRHVLHDLNFRETPPEEQWKLCVPKRERTGILATYHDAPTAGHLGIAKTIARIAADYFWPGMFRDIARYVRACPTCIAYKVAQQQPFGRLHPSAIQRPGQQVTIDLVGPLPRSRKGRVWLLTMQDRFTKWLEMRPLRRATATNVLEALTEAVILRHGCPEEILSDNGTQLRTPQVTAALKAIGVGHRFTPVYAPQCNPVERTNRVVKTMIAQYVGRKHRTWDEHLPEFQFAYNTATHDATGFTPAYLMHGRELRRSKGPPARGPADPPNALRQRLEGAYELVRVQLARAFQRQERHYNLRRREWRPRIGDRVWKKEHTLSSRKDAIQAKLAPKFVGPLEVRRIISPVIVDLRSTAGKWYRNVHIKDVKIAPPDRRDDDTDDDTNDDTDDDANNNNDNIDNDDSGDNDNNNED